MWRAARDGRHVTASEAPSVAILPRTHLAAAKLFESQGLYTKAITQYRKAIAVDHSFVEAYHRLGLLLSSVGRHQDALPHLQRAVQLQPDNPMLLNNYGFELLLNQRWPEATQQLTHAVNLKPDFPRAHVNLGIAQSKMGRFDEALASFRKALPETDAYYNVGLMYRGQQRYTQAAEIFEYVLTLDPQFAAAKTQLAQLTAHLESTATPPWDRQRTKSATRTAQHTDQTRQHRRKPGASAPPARTMKHNRPSAPPPRRNQRSDATPQEPADKRMAASEPYRQQRQRKPSVRQRPGVPNRSTPQVERDRSGNQFDVDSMLSMFEDRDDRGRASRSRSTRSAARRSRSEAQTMFPKLPEPTRTSSTRTTEKSRHAVSKNRPARPGAHRVERVANPAKHPPIKRRVTMTRTKDKKERLRTARRTPSFGARKRSERASRQRSGGRIESFVFDEQFCKAEPWRMFSTVQSTDFTPFNLETGDGFSPESVSCPDNFALLRQLEEELTIVRNQIECLEDFDSVFDGPYERRVHGTEMPPRDADGFYGPPLDRMRKRQPASTVRRTTRRRARLAATVVEDESKQKQRRQSDNRNRRHTTSPTPTPQAEPNSIRKQNEKPRATTDPNGPSARTRDWRTRFETLNDLIEIARNELTCKREARDGQSEGIIPGSSKASAEDVSPSDQAVLDRSDGAWAGVLGSPRTHEPERFAD
jgi:Flp pilus assembly protein TadD